LAPERSKHLTIFIIATFLFKKNSKVFLFCAALYKLFLQCMKMLSLSILTVSISSFKFDVTLSGIPTLSIMKLSIMTLSINNGKEATVNRVLDGSTYPG
jgi:hypothetical protein